MTRAGRTLAAVTVLLSGCGGGVLVDTAPAAPRYDGPLYVEPSAAPDDPGADHAGAASLVVDCDTAPVGYAEYSPYEDSVSRTPLAALERGLREPNRGAAAGLREVRREPDRVLYTYEVERRVRQAMIVHRGLSVEGRTGWYVESWARCDWAELPPELAEGLGVEVWSDAAGRRVPTTRVTSFRGPAHCDWQDMRFLSLHGGDLEDGESYVEHPDRELYPGYLRVPYAEATPLPADARDTGWERDGRHLWLAADRSRAFVGTRTAVAVWPRTIRPLGCA